MSLRVGLRSSGWFIVLSLVGASILPSCGTEPPDFSEATGGTPGEGDTGGSPGNGDTGGASGDGDGNTGGTSGDTGGASSDGSGGSPGDGNGGTDGASSDGSGGSPGDGSGGTDGTPELPMHCSKDDADCSCDDTGCFVELGGTCQQSEMCRSDACGSTAENTNVCCAKACTSDEVCSSDGTSCEAAPVCNESDHRCRDGSYEVCSSGVWTVEQVCDSRGCDPQDGCAEPCRSNETVCDEACVDTQADDDHCGECNSPCPGTSLCQSGACECPKGNENVCGGTCIDVMSDVQNCGECGKECPQPSQTGSSSVCSQGSCGECGGFGQECCGTGSCEQGLACDGESCGCQVGTHRCSTSQTCAADTDTHNCGPTCVDCAQPNAIAQCTNDRCANICPADVLTLCPAGSDGRPSCGLWGFESNTVEGWELDLSDGGTSRGSGPSVGSIGQVGTRSLAIEYDSEAGDSGVWVRVPLCTSGQPVALESETVAAYFRFDSAPGSPPLADAPGVLSLATYSGSTRAASLGVVEPRTWSDSEWQYHTMVAYSLGATHIGFYIGLSDWKGTIRIDDVRVR